METLLYYIASLHEVRFIDYRMKNSNMASCSGATKEIITFQVGNYSNFVGAHYWNLQEALLKDGSVENKTNNELNHDILFRKGLNFQTGQSTCRPRVIAFDLKENIRNFVLTDNSLADNVEKTIIWEGTVEKYDRGVENPSKTETNKQIQENATSTVINCGSDTTSPYNEDTISSWTDFALSQFHDKSLQSIESLHNKACGSFDNFGSGEALFRSPKFRDDFEDRLHFFAEECDRLQGFQVSFGLLTCPMISPQHADNYFWLYACKER